MTTEDAGHLTRRRFIGVSGAVVAGALAATALPAAIARAATNDFFAGANLSGLEVNNSVQPGTPNVDYAVPTNAELDYLAARGLKHVRLPFSWERMQPTLGGALDSDYLALVTSLADHAGANGIGLLLDVHNYGGYGGNKLGDGTLTTADFADLWTRLATAFVGHAGVAGYDLMNEPSNLPSTTAWPEAAQAAVTAIRAVDTATAIYVEGDHWSSSASWVAVNGSLNISDPNDNLLYSAHVYFDRDSSGTHFVWSEEVAAGDQLQSPAGALTTNIGVQRLTGFADWLTTNGFRGHVGEMGTGNDDYNWLVTLDNAIGYCRSNGIGFTYWAAGPWFGSYPMGIEPQKDGRDTLQMAVLEKYSGAASPQEYYLSGPQRGTSGTASTAFTLDYRGYLTSAATFTPSDSGAGGTFTPSQVVFEPGFNGLGTFTYTAAGSATYEIGCTVNTAWTDPAALGFSTRTDSYSSIAASSVLNVLAPQRLYTPFIGSALTLRRASDGATSTFPFSSDDSADTAAISSWAGTSAIEVVTLADQGPNGYDAGPVVTQNHDGTGETQLNSSTADYPQLVLDGLNGMPVLRFQGNRMDAVSPINGLTGFTCFTVAKPSTVAAMSRLLSWHFTEYLLITGDSAGDFEMSGESNLSMGIDPDAWHIYAVRWSGGGSLSTWVDGAQIATATSATTAIDFQYDNHVNIGYFRWYPGVNFAGDVWAMLPFSAALTDTQMSEVWTALSAATGIAV